MRRVVILALALAAATALTQTPTVTCQTSGSYRHCWDTHGNTVLTEQRSPGGYTHSWTPDGKAFTTWDHNGLTTTWPTR
jgi:hypothetical protein